VIRSKSIEAAENSALQRDFLALQRKKRVHLIGDPAYCRGGVGFAKFAIDASRLESALEQDRRQ
jgi:hypothetical protein